MKRSNSAIRHIENSKAAAENVLAGDKVHLLLKRSSKIKEIPVGIVVGKDKISFRFLRCYRARKPALQRQPGSYKES